MASMAKAERRPLTRSEVMARIRSKDTKPELALRAALREAGLAGYRKNLKGLPGAPDVAYTRWKVAVFVDGDFWHGRDFEARRERLAAGSNGAHWVAKILRNRERDARNAADLEAMGWTVLRFWGSDVMADADGCAAVVGRALAGKGRKYGK